MVAGSVTELLSHNERSTPQSAQSDPTNRHSTLDTI